MLSGLLITLDILVGLGIVAVVLMQRSEGGAFGMGGGPTGLITTRGAGDLLTRTTWVLFALFLALSLGLTLLGAHDRATSSVLQQLKGQIANPSALSPQPLAPPAPSAANSLPAAGSPLLAPGGNPLSAPAPQPVVPIAATPNAAAPTKAHEHKPAATPAPAAAAPVLEAPAPKPLLTIPAPAAPASQAPAPAPQP
jgi:preprotein translocase subunit SecG